MIIKSEQANGDCDNGCEVAATHGAVAQGATGRWCEVMWVCESCANKWAGGAEKVLTAQQAREKIEAGEDGLTGYPDF